MGKVVDSINDAVSDVANEVGRGINKVKDEYDRIEDDFKAAYDYMTGEYHDRAKDINRRKEQLDKQIEQYKAGVASRENDIDRLFFFDEIFTMAAGNRLEAYVGKHGPELNAAIEDFNRRVKEFQSDYDFIHDLQDGSFLEQAIFVASGLWLAGAVGGTVSDVKDILKGNANSDTYKRLGTVVVAVVTIVIGILTLPKGGWYAVAAALAILSALWAIDGTYVGSVGMHMSMSFLDAIFNDLLQLEDWAGSDWEDFDNDSENYQNMVLTVQMVVAVATIIANIAAAFSGPPPGATGASGASNFMNSNAIGGVTYSQLLQVYQAAMAVNDYKEANDAYNELKKKLEQDRVRLDETLLKATQRKMMGSYKEVAYFLQDQQAVIDNYIWSMTAQNMYVDPYGTTPVANIRFKPDKDTRVMVFGFEDVFDESSMAGSPTYFSSMLYTL